MFQTLAKDDLFDALLAIDKDDVQIALLIPHAGRHRHHRRNAHPAESEQILVSRACALVNRPAAMALRMPGCRLCIQRVPILSACAFAVIVIDQAATRRIGTGPVHDTAGLPGAGFQASRTGRDDSELRPRGRGKARGICHFWHDRDAFQHLAILPDLEDGVLRSSSALLRRRFQGQLADNVLQYHSRTEARQT